MEKIFHWTNTFKTLGETDDGGIDIKGSASTNALDRAGDIIEAEAWTKGGLDSYKTNPILLFNHDYNCLLYTSPSPRDVEESRMPSSA